jgi:hypothetical protein
MTTLTGEQVRAARALLRMQAKPFAAHVGIGIATLLRLEMTRGPVEGAEPETIQKVVDACRRLGVVFIGAGKGSDRGGPGVRFIRHSPAPAPKRAARTAKRK